ncbi:MAG: Gfo/Idh/MocA family protein [Lautropia sp.]
MRTTETSGAAAGAAPLRLGILGCANIARQFVRDVHAHQRGARRWVSIDAVASRDAAKAAAFAGEFGIARHHGSYDALLADAAVDAIYLPLPNSLHAEWAIAAAKAGKHVLCEKPLSCGLDEACAMFDAARENGVMLLEAYPWWFQPQTREMLALLHGGAIGRVRSVQASFGFTMANPLTNIRLDPALGGGALLDAGSYTLSLIRLAMGEAPLRVQADARWTDGGPVRGVDIATIATLHYADGRHAQLSCAMDVANHRHATIVGTQGTIETEYLNHTAGPGAVHPFGYLPSTLRVRRGIANTVAFETVESACGSGFGFAAEAFATIVAAGDHAAIDRAARASIDIAATLEAIAASARNGKPVDVPVPASPRP